MMLDDGDAMATRLVTRCDLSWLRPPASAAAPARALALALALTLAPTLSPTLRSTLRSSPSLTPTPTPTLTRILTRPPTSAFGGHQHSFGSDKWLELGAGADVPTQSSASVSVLCSPL